MNSSRIDDSSRIGPSPHSGDFETRDDDLAYLTGAMGSDLDTVVVYNLLRTHNYLGPFLEADLREQRLTAAQFNALLVLRSAGAEGLCMGELGRRLVVTKSNVTGLVDRLERQGHVRRVPAEDRRATVVRLTPEGADLLVQAMPRHAELLAELTECLSRREKRDLASLLTKLRRALRRRRKGGRP